jgi:hypothetical protein
MGPNTFASCPGLENNIVSSASQAYYQLFLPRATGTLDVQTCAPLGMTTFETWVPILLPFIP